MSYLDSVPYHWCCTWYRHLPHTTPVYDNFGENDTIPVRTTIGYLNRHLPFGWWWPHYLIPVWMLSRLSNFKDERKHSKPTHADYSATTESQTAGHNATAKKKVSDVRKGLKKVKVWSLDVWRQLFDCVFLKSLLTVSVTNCEWSWLFYSIYL